MFGLGGRRGLAELIEEVYLLDPTQEDPLQFGLGDWLAILRAQRRTGELRVQEDGRTWVLRIVKGSVHSITGPADASARRLGEVLVGRGRITESQNEEAARIQQESGRPYGEVLRALGWTAPEDLRAALTDQVRDRLTGLIALRMPESRFTEMVEAHRPASGGRAAAASDGIVDELIAGPMHGYFKRPLPLEPDPELLLGHRAPESQGAHRRAGATSISRRRASARRSATCSNTWAASSTWS
jgi:hypothetical protein